MAEKKETKDLYAKNREAAQAAKTSVSIAGDKVEAFDKIAVASGFPSRTAAVDSLIDWAIENKGFPE